jgi:DNA-binding beta-propeller fold protein YncE
MFEHRHSPNASEHTSRFWDAYVRGQDASPAPEFADVIRELHQRAAAPQPSDHFAANLEATLMQTATDLAHWPAPNSSLSSLSEVTRAIAPVRIPRNQGVRDDFLRLLAAAVLAFAVVASLFAGAQLWRTQQAFTPSTELPNLEALLVATPGAQATPAPAATAEADGKLADQLWETPMDQTKVLTAPMSLVVNPDGNIWVLDGADDHVQIFSPDGKHLETWGEHGTADGQFDLGGIGDITFASDGTIYVADSANKRVQQFAPDRSFVRAWSDAGNRSGDLASPATASMLSSPNFVAVAPDGSVFVTDESRNVVERYTADGVWMNTLGSDSGDARLNAPRGVSFGPDGNVWVADYGRGRIAVFTTDGTFVREVTGINLPTNLEFDSAGRLLLVDAKGLQVMNEELQPVGRIWRDQGMFTFVPTVASGADGQIYIVDYNLAFLAAFQLRDPLPEPPAPTPVP